MANYAQHRGMCAQQVDARPRRWHFLAPLTTRAHNPFWNRENWQYINHGINKNGNVPGAKVLGQGQNRAQSVSVMYTVPDGYNAYVTAVITTAVLGFFPSASLTIDLSVLVPDALNFTPLGNSPNFIWYALAFASEEVKTITLPLGEGTSLRVHGHCAYSVFGYEMPAAS